MKKSNVFGAVICSAALACSMAMPAFAESATQDNAVASGTSTFTTTDRTQSTIVKGQAFDDATVENYISATVPATLTVVLADPSTSSNGGNFKFVPSASSYKISNSSSKALKVTKIAGTSANADWELKKGTDNNGMPVGSQNYAVSISINGNDVCTTDDLDPADVITINKDSSAGLTIAGKAYWKTGFGTKTALGGGAASIVDIAYTVELAA